MILILFYLYKLVNFILRSSPIKIEDTVYYYNNKPNSNIAPHIGVLVDIMSKSTEYLYDELFIKEIVLRHFKEEYWMGVWRWNRPIDIRFTVNKNTQWPFIYEETRKAFALPKDQPIALTLRDQRIIDVADLRDKELYIVEQI